jgi:hypothetical protein
MGGEVIFDQFHNVLFEHNTHEVFIRPYPFSPTPSPSITPSISLTPSISVTPTPSITPTPSPAPVSGFKTEWSVSGDDTARTISMPFTDNGTYSAIIYWGDGTYSGITSWNDANNTHTYDSDGIYEVEISGSTPGWSFLTYGTHKTKLTNIINWGSSSKFAGFSYLWGGFYNSNIKSTGIGKIQAQVDLTDTTYIFGECYQLTGLTAGFLDNCINITNLIQGFYQAPIEVIPNDLFKYNTGITSVQYCFSNANITYIPTDLFKFNPSISNFSNTFQNCDLLTGITDGDLFNWTTTTCYFDQTFEGCTSLEITADGLLRNSYLRTAVQTFKTCNKLQINPWTFYLTSGDTATRFYDKTVNFDNCFYRDSFTGNQGTAPDLWNCDFGTGTPTYGGCFGGTGNDGTSISNYGDIPIGWL